MLLAVAPLRLVTEAALKARDTMKRRCSRAGTMTRLASTNPAARSKAGLLLACLLAALGLAGCRSGRPTPTPAGPGVIFHDDFSQTNTGWDVYSGADAITDYEAGHYVIQVGEPGINVWSRPGLDLEDAVVLVEAQAAAGPANNEFGVMCRYSRAGDGRNSFYFFLVSSDGYYALGKVVNDLRTILAPPGGFQPSDVIALDAGTSNALRATCQGQRLALMVNGTVLAETTDAELTHGDVGLVAGSYDEGGVRIHFDQFEVRAPGGAAAAP